MISGKDIADTARTYIGVRYRHHGRTRGKGVDCVGLVILVARDLGLKQAGGYSNLDYAVAPDEEMMGRELRANLIEVPISEMREGDIAWFAVPDRRTKTSIARHLAIITMHPSVKGDFGMVHAMDYVGFVAEHHLDATWKKRIKSVFRYRGTE